MTKDIRVTIYACSHVTFVDLETETTPGKMQHHFVFVKGPCLTKTCTEESIQRFIGSNMRSRRDEMNMNDKALSATVNKTRERAIAHAQRFPKETLEAAKADTQSDDPPYKNDKGEFDVQEYVNAVFDHHLFSFLLLRMMAMTLDIEGSRVGWYDACIELIHKFNKTWEDKIMAIGTSDQEDDDWEILDREEGVPAGFSLVSSNYEELHDFEIVEKEFL